jgi:hypothetical protein
MSTKSKSQQAKSIKDKGTVAKASSIDLAQAGASINAAQIKVNKTLASIQAELVEKHGELEAINGTIELKKQELADLHGADNVLRHIDELRVQLEQKKEATDKAVAELEAAEDQAQRDLEEGRRREQEAFDYGLNQRRKAEQDAWAEQVRLRNNQERDREDQLKKGWAEREAELAKKEASYFEALKKAETFEAEVEKRVKEEVNKAVAAVTRDNTHATKLSEVTHKAEVAGLQKDVESAKEGIKRLEGELTATKLQLDKAIEAQVTLAKATVEGANSDKTMATATSLLNNIGGNGSRLGAKG